MNSASQPALILASGSPRRQEMLRDVGIEFIVSVSHIEEIAAEGETPESMVKRLASGKALSIAEKNPASWVIGADTDVSIDGEILGKPRDAADAVRMLTKIQGRTHEVWGAFAIARKDKNIRHVEAHKTVVELAPMPLRLIEWYVSTGEPLDKAGAYGAQGIGAQFVRSVSGSFSNVVGLPLEALMRALRQFKIVEDYA